MTLLGTLGSFFYDPSLMLLNTLKLTHFLGLQICQQDSGIFLSQSKYAKNLVKNFGLEFASSIKIPMSPNVKLTVDLLGKSVDSSLYRSMIGSLLYLTASRPNIS